jgi:hypothetical protein
MTKGLSHPNPLRARKMRRRYPVLNRRATSFAEVFLARDMLYEDLRKQEEEFRRIQAELWQGTVDMYKRHAKL